MLKISDDLDVSKLNPEMAEFLKKFQLKHSTIPFTLVVKGKELKHADVGRWVLDFHDERLLYTGSTYKNTVAGSVSYSRGYRKETTYNVHSRLITNAKYSQWSRSDHHSNSSKKMENIIKIAVDKIKPFDWSELLHSNKEQAQDRHKVWSHEFSHATASFRLDYQDVYEELCNLVSQNVVFKTNAFIKAVDNMKLYAEHQEKSKKEPTYDVVYFFKDKILYKGFKNSEYKELNSVNELTETQQQRMALLRMGGDEFFIPEVGFRKLDSFFIYIDS
jgi:head-tail adaptor